jgi:putative membrane protein
MQKCISLGALGLVLAFALMAMDGAAAQQRDVQDLPLDREFLIKTITCNHAEIRASELATSRASNAKVKEFANKLIKEHKDVSERLTELAKNFKLAILAGTEKETKDMLDRLGNLSDAGFDKEYMKTMVNEHEKAVQMFEAQAKKGTDASLREFATTTLPTLRAHLTEAKKISTELKGN